MCAAGNLAALQHVRKQDAAIRTVQLELCSEQPGDLCSSWSAKCILLGNPNEIAGEVIVEYNKWETQSQYLFSLFSLPDRPGYSNENFFVFFNLFS